MDKNDEKIDEAVDDIEEVEAKDTEELDNADGTESASEFEKEVTGAHSAKEDKLDEEAKVSEIEGEDKEKALDTEGKPTLSIPKEPKRRHLKKALIILGIFIILGGIVAAVPFLRYGLVGLFVHKDVTLTVVDAVTSKPVSGAKVSFGRQDATSDAAGHAVFKDTPVGEHDVVVKKNYYKTTESTLLVPIFNPIKDGGKVQIKATGRTITITVKNAISDAVVSGATVTLNDSTAQSDAKGVATVVVSVGLATQDASIKADGYNDGTVTVDMKKNDDQSIDAKLVPAGKIFFLSKRTGTIDVMSVNLDGSSPQVVVKGTGKETDDSTRLIASPDWKTLALVAKRDGSLAKLYMITTATGKIKEADGSDASYEPIGWVSNRFFYTSSSNLTTLWQNNAQSVVSYNPDSGTKTVVDSLVAEGSDYNNYAAERMSSVYVVADKVVYTKGWSYGSTYAGSRARPVAIVAVTANGNIKNVVKEIAASDTTYVDAMLRKPDAVDFRYGKTDTSTEYYEYAAGGSVVKITSSDDAFYNSRLTYVAAPAGDKVFWSEPRDGKNVLFEGPRNLAGPTKVNTGLFTPYGWFGSEYVLYSKGQSELFIAPAGAAFNGELKVTDFHKGQPLYPGFGNGYTGV